MADKDQIKLEMSVTPFLDKKATANLIRDIKKLDKDVSQSEKEYKSIVRAANVSAKEINKMSESTAHLMGRLNKAARDSSEGLKKMGETLADLHDQAKTLEKTYASETDDSKKDDIRKKYKKLNKTIKETIKDSVVERKSQRKHSYDVKQANKSFRDSIKTFNEFADYKPADAMKGFADSLQKAVTGDFKSGVVGMFKSVSKAGIGHGARGIARKASAVGGAKGAAMMSGEGNMMGSVMSGLSVLKGLAPVLTGLAAVFTLVKNASEHISSMNKALLEGSGLAGDLSLSTDEYRGMLDNFRESAHSASSSLLKYGIDSKASLGAVAEYSKKARGSLSALSNDMKDIGGSLTGGIEVFSAATFSYGKALNMEQKEVAGFIGDLVSEVGYHSDNMLKTMAMVVKQASSSGMPVTKFMDVFKSALPNLDLYTNRMEQLTGVMNLLSRSMSPRGVEKFMRTMTQGFDQMDFKQRLKMAFVIGPGKVNKMMVKQFDRNGKEIAREFGGLGDDLQAALKSSDPVSAVAKVVARAQAAGNVSAEAMGTAMELARHTKSAGKGGVLQTATAMRGADMVTQMKLMEEYAGNFTGGDITGLGEHVAKQLGVSEDQYRAILSLRDTVGMYQQEVSMTGLTHSESLNKNLEELRKQSGYTMSLQELADKEPKKFKDMLLDATSMQIKDLDKTAVKAEDLAAEQYNATSSVSEKMDSVIGYWLERVYLSVSSIVDTLNDMFSWSVRSDEAGQKIAQERKKQASRDASATRVKDFFDQFGTKTFKEAGGKGDVNRLNKTYGDLGVSLQRGAGAEDIMKQMQPFIWEASGSLEKSDIGKLQMSSDDKALLDLALQSGPDAVRTTLESWVKRGTGEQAAHRSGLLASVLAGKGIDVEGDAPYRASTSADKRAREGSDQSKEYNERVAAATSSGSSYKEPVTKGEEEQISYAKDTLNVQEKIAKDQKDSTDRINKGIPIDRSWTNGPYKNATESAVSNAVSDAMLTQWAFEQRVSKDPELGTKFLENFSNAYGAKQSHMTLAKTGVLPEFGDGGSVPRDMIAKIHAGEYVIPRSGALVKDSGSSKVVNISGVTIQVQTNADPKQIAEAVHDLYRRH